MAGFGFCGCWFFYLTDPDVSVCEQLGLQASVCPAYNYGFVGPEGPMLPGLVARAYSFFLQRRWCMCLYVCSGVSVCEPYVLALSKLVWGYAWVLDCCSYCQMALVPSAEHLLQPGNHRQCCCL